MFLAITHKATSTRGQMVINVVKKSTVLPDLCPPSSGVKIKVSARYYSKLS